MRDLDANDQDILAYTPEEYFALDEVGCPLPYPWNQLLERLKRSTLSLKMSDVGSMLFARRVIDESRQGLIYTWGRSVCGCLGQRVTTNNHSSIPKLPDHLNDNKESPVIDVQCNQYSVCVLKSDGRICMTGAINHEVEARPNSSLATLTADGGIQSFSCHMWSELCFGPDEEQFYCEMVREKQGRHPNQSTSQLCLPSSFSSESWKGDMFSLH